MAITGINNSSYTSYYASGYKNTVKKAACDIQKTKENSQVSKTEESQEDYVKKLQEKNPQIDIVAGSSDKNVKTANRTGKTDVRIAPQDQAKNKKRLMKIEKSRKRKKMNKNLQNGELKEKSR